MGYPTTDRRGLAISQSIAEIETPALLVDVGRMEQNIQRLTSTLSASDVAIRSHIKSHKIPDLAHQQVRATGADKITCQTLSEAEVMALSGFHDIHLVRMVVSNEKVERLVWLADRVDNFVTNVDCRGNIVPLQDTAARNDLTVPVFLEIDVGVNRTGVTPAEAPAMANLIEEQSNLRLAGIVGHDGFARSVTERTYPDGVHIEAEIERVEEALEEYAEVDSDELETASDALEAATESLSEELQEIGKQMYQQQAAQGAAGAGGAGAGAGGMGGMGGMGGAGPGGPGGAGGAEGDDEEFVDADFEDVQDDDEDEA